MIAGYHEAPIRQLNAVGGTGGVPGPGRILRRRRDFLWFGPGHTVVLRPRQPDGARRLAFGDQPLVTFGQILAEEQTEGPRPSVDHRTGVAAGHVRLGHQNLCHAPALTAVFAAAQQQVDLAAVGRAVPSPLTEREDGILPGHHQRRDAVCVVLSLTADEEFLLLQPDDFQTTPPPQPRRPRRAASQTGRTASDRTTARP